MAGGVGLLVVVGVGYFLVFRPIQGFLAGFGTPAQNDMASAPVSAATSKARNRKSTRRARPSGQCAPHGGVDRLGAAGSEDDLAGPHAEQGGHLVPCVLQDGPDDAALGVDPARVGGDAGGGPLVHGRACLRPQRGGGGVVEVVAGHGGRQTTAAQASSPRARDDDSTTGTAPGSSPPHSPASSPLTMPRSTALHMS